MVDENASLRRFLAAPAFPDRDVGRIAAAVHTIGLYLAGTAASWMVVAPFVTADPWAGLALAGMAATLGLLSVGLARAGHVQWASCVLVGMIWIVSTLAILYGGLESPAFSAFLIAIVLAGLLIGARGAVWVAGTGALSGGLTGLAQFQNLLPAPVLEQTLLTRWGIEVTLFGAAAGVVAIYLKQIRDAERELNASREGLLLSQKMEALGRLAGGIAHDFNNLLTAIGGYGELVQRSLEPGDPNRQEMDEILRAADRAGDLTKRLLAFGRRKEFRPMSLDLNDVVSGMQSLIERLVGEDVEVELMLAPHLGTVRADPGQIEQVLMNLVVNARDAMPQGGRISILTKNLHFAAPETVASGTLDPGDYVALVVADTGVGMDDETRDHLFEPFYTTKEFGKGTGLGLSILFGIARQSNAGVQVESRVGQGTRFRLLFPRSTEPADNLDERGEGPLLKSGTETVLVAEDDVSVLRLTSHILRDRGYHVLEARNGEEALRIAQDRAGPIDLLLTDVIMPGIRGPQLAKMVLTDRPDLRVLFVSGYSAEGLQSQADGTQWAYLRKPFVPRELIHTVRETLDGR